MSGEVTNVCGCTVLEAIPAVMYNSSELLKAMVIPVSSYGCLISWKRAYAWLLTAFSLIHLLAKCSFTLNVLSSSLLRNKLPPGQLSYKM